MHLPTHTDSQITQMALDAHRDMIMSMDTYLDDMDNEQKELDYLNTDKCFSMFQEALQERDLHVNFPNL